MDLTNVSWASWSDKSTCNSLVVPFFLRSFGQGVGGALLFITFKKTGNRSRSSCSCFCRAWARRSFCLRWNDKLCCSTREMKVPATITTKTYQPAAFCIRGHNSLGIIFHMTYARGGTTSETARADTTFADDTAVPRIAISTQMK